MALRIFLDTEFIQGFHKPLFGKRRHFLDLISIALISDDGREYHAISREYRYNDASDWVKENVIRKEFEKCDQDVLEICDETNFHKIVGKTHKEIAHEIIRFLGGYWQNKFPKEDYDAGKWVCDYPVEFWGDCTAQDWTIFCSLFGDFSQHPSGFPYYCKDIRQEMDALKLGDIWEKAFVPQEEKGTVHTALDDAKYLKKLHSEVMRVKAQEQSRIFQEQIRKV